MEVVVGGSGGQEGRWLREAPAKPGEEDERALAGTYRDLLRAASLFAAPIARALHVSTARRPLRLGLAGRPKAEGWFW